MAASITAIRGGLKTNLTSIAGLQCYDFVPAKPEPPCAIVMPNSDVFIERLSMARGHIGLTFVVTVLVENKVDDESQDRIDAYLDPSGSSSAWAAIESSLTLSGVAENAVVQQIRNYTAYTFNDIPYLGAEIVVGVLAAGA